MKPKQIQIILAAMAILLYAGVPAKAINIDDGQNHIFSDSTYADDWVDIDAIVANNPGTHVQVVDGAAVLWIGAAHYSTIQVDGGTIYMGMQSAQNATITVNGGTAGGLKAAGQSTIELNGGTLRYMDRWPEYGGAIIGCDYSTVNIRGGTFSQLRIESLSYGNHGGTIYVYGTNFSVGSQQLNYGDHLRNFAVTNQSGNLTGTVTGTLLDGTSFSVPFFIYSWVTGGDIIVIPEPCTIALLALGLPLFRTFSKKK